MNNSEQIFGGYPDPQGCRDFLKRFLVGIAAMAALFYIIAVFSSCKSQQPCIPTVEYRTKDSIVDHYYHDTTRIYHRDSVIVREKGDTIYIDRWHDRWLEKIIIQKDSTSDNDNEQQVQTVEVVPVYYRRCSWALWILVAAIIVFIVLKILIRIYVKH